MLLVGRTTGVRTRLVRPLIALALVAGSVFVADPPGRAWKTFVTSAQVNATYWGGTGTDYAWQTAIDASGNQYVVGSFASSNVDFNPGAGTAIVSSVGEDIYVTKFNSSGDFVWVKTIGGASDERATSIVADSSGNIYVGGNFFSSVDFDPGAGTTTLTAATNTRDAFILKLDSAGNFQWVKQITGPPPGAGQLGQKWIYSLAITSTSLYASGDFWDTADFDPGPGTANLVSNGQTDAFVAKYDLNGNYQWAKSFGSTGTDTVTNRSLVADSSGVYAVGAFQGTVNFNSAGTANLSSANINTFDAFFLKLDDQGAYQWATNVGDEAWGVAVDVAGGYVHSTGTFSGTQDFDPGAGTSNLTATLKGAYILTLDTNGTFVRAVKFDGSYNEEGRKITVDSSGNVLATGKFSTASNGTVDFNPGPGTASRTGPSAPDEYGVKLTRAGNYVWARQFASTDQQDILAITTDASDNAIVTGHWYGTLDLDVSVSNPPFAGGTTGVTSSPAFLQDAFIAKMARDTGYTDTTAPTCSLATVTINGAAVVRTIRNIFAFSGNLHSETGLFYLVRDSVVVTDLASILATTEGNASNTGDWRMSPVSSFNGTTFATYPYGLRDGTYYGYAVDQSENLSARCTGSIKVDSTTPVPSLTISRSGSGTLTTGQTTTLTIVSSEELQGMWNSRMTVTGGTVGALTKVSGKNEWTGTFTPTASSVGTAQISITANKVLDLDGNGNDATSILSIDYDTQSSPTTTTTTTVAPTTTTVAPASVTTTTVPKTPYSDWTVSISPASVSPGDSFDLEVSVSCPNRMNNLFNTGTPTGTPLFKYEVVSTSTLRVLTSGDAWRGLQVLSNNGYTVTWTQSVSAPATVGTYTVQVYSVGAAADYLYCRILPMNTRHDGPRTSLTVRSAVSATSTVAPTTTTITTTVAPTTTTVAPTTTTSSTLSPTTTQAPPSVTTTTVPPLPVPPDALERVDPSQPTAIVGGQPSVVDVVERPASLELTVGGVVATVGGVSGGNNPLALNDSGEVEVTTAESVRFTLEGFKPNSQVDLWLYSRDQAKQRFLGSFFADEVGAVSEDVDVRSADVTGSVDLVISGTNEEGESVSIGVPMQVVQIAKTNGFVFSLLAALLFAVGSFFTYKMLRRRDDVTTILQDRP